MQPRRTRSLPNIGSNQRHYNIPLQNQFSDSQRRGSSSFGNLAQNCFTPFGSNINPPPQQTRHTFVPQQPASASGVSQSEYESFLAKLPPSFALYQSKADKYRDPVTGRPRAQSTPIRSTHIPQQSTFQQPFALTLSELADMGSDPGVRTRTRHPATRPTMPTTGLEFSQGEGGSSAIPSGVPPISSPELPLSTKPQRYRNKTLRRMSKELKRETDVTDQRSLAERLTDKHRNVVKQQIKERKGRDRRLIDTLQSLGYSYSDQNETFADPTRVVPPEVRNQRQRLEPQPRFQERVDRDDTSSVSSSVGSVRSRVLPIDPHETVFLNTIIQRSNPTRNQRTQQLRESHDRSIAKALLRRRKGSYRKNREDRMRRVETDSILPSVQFASLSISDIPEDYESTEDPDDDNYREFWF